jgi:predicted alpha-1,2-mannosidase
MPGHVTHPLRARRRLVTWAPAVLITATGLIAGAALAPAGASTIATATVARDGQAGPVTDPASLVNPFIGTSNEEDTFPGADAPFGMVQWSPDTSPLRPDGGGYSYGYPNIIGFSLNHLSGPGCAAEGDVPILPTTGKIDPTAIEPFSHAHESADAGHYQVTLGNKVTADLTATTRTGMARFTFPATAAANLIFKLDDSEDPDTATSFKVVSDTEVQGSVTSGGFCSAANTYTVHFDLQFSQPFTKSGTFTASGLHPGARTLSLQAVGAPRQPAGAPRQAAGTERPDHPVYHGSLPRGRTAPPALTGPDGAYLTFDTTSHQTLLAKVGLSYVSDANAAANLKAENPGWDFGTTLAATHAAWNAMLGKIAITGGTHDQQVEFYTALYHALLHPNVFSDDNGQYMGVDGKVHTVDAGHSAFYTNFSGWDIYRSQAELEALIDPQAASDTAESMIDDYTQDGMLPKWMENNGETYIMVGDPADSILAGYYAFGARDFDTSAALSDMVAQASTPGNIRPGLQYQDKLGYLPVNGTYGCCNYYGPVSTSLEYDTADFAISALAGDLGNPADQQKFLNRSQDWWNVLDTASGFIQPRNANATWTSAFAPNSETDFVEADSWIYTGMVPYDLAGLAQAKGGDTAMAAYLSTVLRSYLGLNGFAWLGNEPSIELPWEWDYIGQPYQTQNDVRQIQDELWSDTPAGLGNGNDDLGTMSAWFVWSALGLYPMTPGTPNLALGSPMFSQEVITLPSGHKLTIDGNGAADNAPYVQSATWNGAAWNDAYAPPSAITSGGTLAYTLGTSPNTSWASAASAAPPSYTGQTIRPPQPWTGPIKSGVSSSLCLGGRGNGGTPGSPAQVGTCTGGDGESWTIAPGGTISALGQCLGVAGRGTKPGTKVNLQTCDGAGAQRWAAGSGGSLVNHESHLCLDDPGGVTTAGTRVEVAACGHTTAGENWVLPTAPPSRVGAVVSGVSSTLCVDDRGSVTTNGNPVEIATCAGTAAQHWTVEPDGTLRVLGLCLDVTRGTPALIAVYACNGTAAQQWRIESGGSLVNPRSGKCLADPGATTKSGTQLQLATCEATAAQDWKLPS